jgi:hypothetical protein
LQEAVTIEEGFEVGRPPGEAAHDLLRGDLLAGFLAEAELLIDQPDGRLRVIAQFRMSVEEFLGGRTMAPPPGCGHLLGESVRQEIGSTALESWVKGVDLPSSVHGLVSA